MKWRLLNNIYPNINVWWRVQWNFIGHSVWFFSSKFYFYSAAVVKVIFPLETVFFHKQPNNSNQLFAMIQIDNRVTTVTACWILYIFYCMCPYLYVCPIPPRLGRGPWPNVDILTKLIGGVTATWSRGVWTIWAFVGHFHLTRMIYQLCNLLLFCSGKIMISIPNFHMTKHDICRSIDSQCHTVWKSTFEFHSLFQFWKKAILTKNLGSNGTFRLILPLRNCPNSNFVHFQGVQFAILTNFDLKNILILTNIESSKSSWILALFRLGSLYFR